MTNITKISSAEAAGILAQGNTLTNFIVEGTLSLRELSRRFKSKISIRNCIFENLQANGAKFLEPFELIDCNFNKCNFSSSQFKKGLIIQNCVFREYLDFADCGHNNGPVTLENNIFKSFVNFTHCRFQNEVHVIDNMFLGGTNLVGNMNGQHRVSFNVKPDLRNNKGELGLLSDPRSVSNYASSFA